MESIRAFYDMWPQYDRRLREVVEPMTAEQLAVRPAPERWPVWATVGHTAAARVYWLCHVLGERGAEATPWPAPTDAGWEDDLGRPRGSAELVEALRSSFAVVEGVLDRWSPGELGETIERRYGDAVQVHHRGSVVQRLFSHDAYHCGELSQTLGMAGLPQIDLWRPD
jgi:hypothetical protein